MKSYTLTTAPAVEPVTTGEALAYLRADSGAEDALIETLISAARGYVETLTGRALITQVWTMRTSDWTAASSSVSDISDISRFNALYYWSPLATDNGFAGRVIELDRTPLVSVTSVKYYPADGGAQATLSASEYTVDVASEPGRIVLNETASWPELASRPDAVEILFTAGYGSARTDVPAELRLAVNSLTAWFYTQRLPANVGNIVNQLPHALDAIIKKYRVRGMVS